jgi:TolB-like protein/predicted ATPase
VIYRFENFSLDPARRELRRGEALLAVEPQVFDVLEHLIRNRERVVSKDELLSAVWKGRIVSDATLASRINAARTALADSGEEQRLIKTVPRKGVRFLGHVREEAGSAPPAAADAIVDTRGECIAVLPLLVMGGDSEHGDFADGLAEDLITALSKLPGLQVIARNSSFAYRGRSISIRQVGAELGARFVLEGSVRAADRRLRVTAQLIEAETDRHLWADRYDLRLEDIFAAQDTITKQVVAAIERAVRGQPDADRQPQAGGSPGSGEPSPQAQAERRHLTVMACELVEPDGTSGLDVEDLRDLVESYQRCVAEVAGRFRGLVRMRTGNAVLVHLGHPAAHEDDAERAVRAALDLCAAVRALGGDAGALPQCRVGIATGMTIVADPLANDSEIIGEAPNLALRLQGVAPTDGVVIDRATKQLIGEFFECRALDPTTAVGLGSAGPIWQVLGSHVVESRFEALRPHPLTPLVGREEELELLRRRWVQARGGEGRVVMIAGEPGIGKSRLALAAEEMAQGDTHVRLRYFCSPHQSDTALFPFIGQLERAARFQRGDSAAERVARLQALLRRSKADADHALALLGRLLSLPPDPRHPLPDLPPSKLKEKMLAALLAQLERLAAERPVLMIFEDLHWIDPTSLELLTRIVDRIPSLPALMVVTFRPEFQAPWTGLPHVTMLSLSRLGARDGAALVQRIAGERALPSDAVAEIVERADGIPLFVEELTKTVLEGGANAAETARTLAAPPAARRSVPAILHASLSARIDRLGPARQIAEIGAAIGREFSYDLLAALAPLAGPDLRGAVDRLVEAGLLFRRGDPPEATFLFKHALVQETAYSTLLREPRRELHRRIARVLLEKAPELAETKPELLAHHYTEAGLAQEAMEFWGRAGQKSLARSALAEAVAQLKRGLSQADGAAGTPAQRREQIKLQVALANALMHAKGFSSPEVLSAWELAMTMVEQAEARDEHPDDPLLYFSIMYGLWAVNYVCTNVDVMLALARQALARAEKLNAPVPLIIGNRLLGTSLFMLGEFETALSHFDRALPLYSPEQHRPLAARFGQDIGATVLAYRSWTSWLVGSPERARQDMEAMILLARSIGHTTTLMYVLGHAAVVQVYLGDMDSVEAHGRELLALGEEKGAPVWRAWGMIMLGWAMLPRRRFEDTLELVAGGLAVGRATGATNLMQLYLTPLILAYVGLGRFAEARDCLAQAFGLVEKTGERWAEADLHRLAGEVALACDGDAKSAEACFHRALAIARRQNARAWELRAATSLAALWRDQGRCDQAHDLLAPVYGWFTEGLDTADLLRAKALLDTLRGEGGDPTPARQDGPAAAPRSAASA